MMRKLAAVLWVVPIVGPVACSRPPALGSAQALVGRPGKVASTGPAHRSGEPAPIWQVLDDWVAGRQDEAVAGVLKLYDEQAADNAWRPYPLSEKEFVALSAERRTALQQEMIDRGDRMRELGKELRRRAIEAAQRGDSDQATRLVGALRRFGQANRGEEVTLLMDLYGKYLEKLADQPLLPPPTQPGAAGP